MQGRLLGWVVPHRWKWLLACILVILAVQSGPAQLVRVAFVATEANNQHKLVAHRGTLYVTYTRPVDGTPQVYVDTSPDGRRWRTLGQISRGSGPSTLSTLVVDGAGRIHVAWTQFDGPIGRVYYSQYAGGWSEPKSLSPATAYAGYPSMDIDSHGRLHLVWYGIREASAGQPTGHGGIYEIYYLSNDGSWSPPERISQGVPDSINPALAVDARDRIHVAWFQSDGQAYQVTYALRAARWSTPLAVTSGLDPSTKPALAVDRSGRAHIVWERNGAIYYMSQEGERWTAPLRLSADGSRHPTVGISPRGVFVLWQDADGVIALRAFDGRWGSVRRLEAGEHPNAAPWRPALDPKTVAVWTTRTGIKVMDLSRLFQSR